MIFEPEDPSVTTTLFYAQVIKSWVAVTLAEDAKKAATAQAALDAQWHEPEFATG